MDKNLAELLMKKLHALDEPFDDVMDIIEQIPDEEEMNRLRFEMLDLSSRFYTRLMVPILRQYPELDPDKEMESSDTE